MYELVLNRINSRHCPCVRACVRACVCARLCSRARACNFLGRSNHLVEKVGADEDPLKKILTMALQSTGLIISFAVTLANMNLICCTRAICTYLMYKTATPAEESVST